MLSLVTAHLLPQPAIATQHPGARYSPERHAVQIDILLALRATAMAVRVTVAEEGGHEAGRVAKRAEQDRALFARYLDKRDPVDREMLVERFLPLARQLARRYQRPEEPFDDLFQVACLGLVKAID